MPRKAVAQIVTPEGTHAEIVADPLNVNVRLYRQASELLRRLEVGGDHVTLREFYMCMVAVGRIQVMFMGLRKEKVSDANAGSSVRKYEAAFKTNDARGRKAIARPAEPDTDPGFDDEWGTDDDDDTADAA